MISLSQASRHISSESIEYNCHIMTFRVGSFVKLQGLANATHYNGMTGVVVGNLSKEERYPVQLLDHLETWDETAPDPGKECGGKILTAKRTNLVPSNDSEHWKIMGESSIYELTVSTDIGFEDDSYKYIKRVWDRFFETVPTQAMDNRHMSFMLEQKGHMMYWLKCDAIMCHLLIEKARGRYRIFQSFVDEGPIAPGYTARQWCGEDPPLVLTSNPIWKKYGRGLTVSKKEVEYLFNNIKQMQEIIPSLLPYLLEMVPSVTPKDIKILQKGAEKVTGDAKDWKRAVEVIKIGREWAADVMSKMGPIGITEYGGIAQYGPLGYKEAHGDKVLIYQGQKCIFQIPKKLYAQVHELMCQITSRDIFSPVVFVKMVNMGIWWNNIRGTNGFYIGFAYHGARVDLRQTEEEGIKAAEAMRKICLDEIQSHISNQSS